MPATERLQGRIREFLPTVRVGIDFGEHTGGIAVVRGNEILHAETYLDFHEATLEQRRILRRGRRSRHAKRMRLARLRSWILRQRVNGKQLPDPYAVMHDVRFMVQPGVFREDGTNPRDAESWIRLVKDGRGNAASFVRALTLIFQKRGYRWDAVALEEMNDAKLKEFLWTARVPTDDPALAEQVRALIQRRKDDPDDPVRGKIKVKPEELEALLAEACERGKRPPRPRWAEHRSVKEAELRAVVEGFERAVGLPNEISDRWKRELCKLLNKVLRPARFENRLKTGCAWCGKSTPRKVKVREIAYRAAVQNLRKREGFRVVPLDHENQKPFFDWWANPAQAPGVETIGRRLEKLNAGQKKMARQLYDLLKNQTPKGRTNLCVEHLSMAAEGKTLSDAGVPWQRIAVRRAPNPCAENRDARILKRLERLLFMPGCKGEAAWRFGPVALVSLEVPEPDTFRAKKGAQTERKTLPLKERLAAETDGCVYKVLGACGGEMDKDHIFPRSRGGPDVQTNLVAACNAHNKEKDNRTPYEWLNGDPVRWGQFEEHVRKLPVPEAKKKVLLSIGPEYPEDDPTPLARAGARPRQFVVHLAEIFRRYEVEPPQIHYELDRPLVQRIRGSETHWFRLSWCRKADGSENFPYPKNRFSLFNHAEDAAILAAIPPHTWRALVRVHSAERPLRDGKLGQKSGLAVPELAPDWAGFLQRRKHPLVRVLGRYPITWKSKFADLTFWRKPFVDTPRIRRTRLLRDLQRKDFENIVSQSIRSVVEKIAEEAGLGDRGTILEAQARKLAGETAKRTDVERAKPAAAEELEKTYPGLRRVQVWSQKGGSMALVRPADGPVRKVQIKPASEGIVLWQRQDGKKRKSQKLHISLIRPRPLQRFGFPRIDKPIPDDATEVGRLMRHQIIWLEQEPGGRAGFFRVTKCQGSGVTVVPEEEIPAEISRRSGRTATAEGSGTEPEAEEPGGIRLGKQELARYFAQRDGKL